jgi:hypothetical protein
VKQFEKAAGMNVNEFTTPMYLMKAGILHQQGSNWSAAAIRAMHNGRYDAARDRFRRLETHELLARDITAAVDAGAPERETEFLTRVNVRLRAQ